MTELTGLLSTHLQSIDSVLGKIESMRKKYVPLFFLYGTLIPCLPTLIIFMLYLNNYLDIVVFFVCTLIFYVLSYVIMHAYYEEKLTQIYKTEVMPDLVSLLNSPEENRSCSYTSQIDPDIQIFHKSGLFEEHNNETVSGEDQINGKIGKTDFSLYEVTYRYEIEKNNDKEETVTAFDGILFDADFNKQFNGITILSDSSPDDWRVSQKVKLEDPLFNQRFNVYSTDPVEACYILSPALQQRLTTMLQNLDKNIPNSGIKISFYDSRILILIETGRDYFEANLFSPIRLERVKQDFKLITDLISLIEDLNLNNRIWTKQ